ncbi:LysR family transcriptional regulator, partial [Vibrio antiquarius]
GAEADLHVIYQSRQYQPKRVRLFLDFLVEQFSALSDTSNQI